MHNRLRIRLLFLCMTALLLSSGCALGPEYARPGLDLPSQWRPDMADQGKLLPTWWTLFNDATLNELVETALVNNLDLAIAMARVEEARAYLGVARSAQLPSLNIQGDSSRGQPSGPVGVDNKHAGVIGVSFDLDLWGKYRRATESARAELLATEAAYKIIRLAVTAETIRAYFTLLSVDRQLDSSRNTLKARQRGEAIYRSRFKEGLSGEFEFRQSEVETTIALAQVQQLEIAQVQAKNALAVLLGKSPREMTETSITRTITLNKLTVPDFIPTGLPASLITRRPDIVEAEHLLHAATADIGVARAAFLPDISLTGLFGWASTEFHNFVQTSTRQWSLGAQALQPVFQGGRLMAQLDAADARQKAAYAQYQKTVLNAYREVLDSLTANKMTRRRVVTIQKQVASLRRAMTLANLRYESGQASFLEVLDAQRALFNAEIERIKSHQAQLEAVVILCQALGGGWE